MLHCMFLMFYLFLFFKENLILLSLTVFSLGDGTNPSRDNLLLHEDEYSELSEEDSDIDWNRRDSWNSHVRIMNLATFSFFLYIIFVL